MEGEHIKMFKVINAKPERFITALAGSDLYKGQLAVLSTNEAVAAAAAISAATAYGIVLEDALDGTLVQLYPLIGTELECDIYQGGSTKVFEDANIGTAFDMNVATNEMTIDPNDVTGAFFVLTGYNNDAQKCYGRIAIADIFLA